MVTAFDGSGAVDALADGTWVVSIVVVGCVVAIVAWP